MRTLPFRFFLLCIITILIIVGCTVEDRSPVTPEPILPEYWTGEEDYICGEWHDQRPDATYILVDIAVTSSVPILEKIELLKSHGAYIRHVFNVPMIRVIISVNVLESLGAEYSHALGVTDPDSYLVERLIIMYDHVIDKSDSTSLMELGVDIIRESYTHTFISVNAQDEVIHIISQLSGVTNVSLNYFACYYMSTGNQRR